MGDLLELAYGKALKATNRKTGTIPVYGSNGVVGWHHEPLISGPGIIVGRKGNPGTVTWVSTDFFPIDTTFYVVNKINNNCLHFLLFALQRQNLNNFSSDTAVPGLNRNIVYMNKQLIPSIKILIEFEKQTNNLFDRIHNFNIESSLISQLRDTLLPKLIYGHLRISDAKRIAGRCI